MENKTMPDPLRPHRHDPNPHPPSPDPSFVFVEPGGMERIITLAELQTLPQTTVHNCYIVSTGHGTSGPFIFTGTPLLHLIQSRLAANISWTQVEVISADGFGNRVMAEELHHPDESGPIILSYQIDGEPMSRKEGLIRMIVPSEKDDALRQVKWIGWINVRE